MTASNSDPSLAVGENTVVTVEFWIMSTDGEALDDSGGPVSFLYRGLDSLLPRLDDGLEGKTAGFEQTFHLEPSDAFGDYDPELLRVEPRSRFPEPIEVGMQFEGVPGDTGDDEETEVEPDDGEGDENALIFSVTDLTDDKVVLDANHPYAGMALRVRIKLLEVRPADQEEIEQGYADSEDESDDVLDALIEARRNPGTLH
ncbi:peptidylprolyl isomerase [Pigmentiphaga sp. GD03639]|uniref:peptidylprolyl isomerase n=1 Tax=Pigmentiphaga daeguensis TaxID=414049 RepID=A0ABP3LFE2_9BURK|nr:MULTISPECIES: peptidylprolyl isomerase [unclassified Pigmentiphaga]MDH2234869.1 peptidylprolyl isomerase [Pigmentiphaga sp. GD03639]